jgi:hypothetical protein
MKFIELLKTQYSYEIQRHKLKIALKRPSKNTGKSLQVKV